MKTFLFVLACAVAFSVQAQLPRTSPRSAGFDPARLEVLHATTKQFVGEGKHAGIITLIARDGKIVDFQAYGLRDVEKQLPMERDTICRAYSMSKIITCAAALMLLEDGKYNLDDPVAKYLPELKNMKVWTDGTQDEPKTEALKRPITIKHLLTHTSGLIYDFMGNDELTKTWRAAELWSGPGLTNFTAKLGKLPLKHQPGDAFTYGVNQDVLGALIERVSGQRFGAFLEERMFRPLGMKDTGFDVPTNKMNRLAKTYKVVDGKFVEDKPIIDTWPEEGRGIEAGGAGIFSTAGDFARFAQMLCNGGTLDGKRILGRKTIELMTADHMVTLTNNPTASPRQKGFGLGVEVTTDLGRLSMPSSIGQFGWYGAATTYCQIDPKERIVAIAMVQHFPFNQHNFFAAFQTGYYQALK
ncbi:MAG TPA: serine hydrolase domain-containing protein [Candidatus Acidoferrum sp.]|nr:serine hydrolase domain-containing protein [Candidatus Acidoferrum sp.]